MSVTTLLGQHEATLLSLGVLPIFKMQAAIIEKIEIEEISEEIAECWGPVCVA